MNKKVVTELPSMIKLPESEVEERVRLELALRLYEKGILSFGQARRLASLSKWKFIEVLKKEGIGIPYDEEDLNEDLETLKELGV